MKKRLFIIDLDGVITSTTDEHFEAWSLLFKKHFNVQLDERLETYTKGVSRIESFKILLEKSHLHLEDQNKMKTLTQEKNEIYQNLISEFDENQLLPGTLKLLQYLKDNQVKIALGSASKNGPFLLKQLKIEHYFDYIVDPSHLKSKPHPDIFLNAMDHFEMKPEDCVGIEDAVSGVQAIKKADMFAIGVGPEALDQADWKIKDLSYLDYDKLDQLIEGTYERD